MDIKELEEKSSPPTKEVDSTKQVTSTVKKTETKRSAGRTAAGKKLAEHNKKAREAKNEKQEIPNEQGSFSLMQILSVTSIVVSLAGLYYKRKELMSFVKPEKNDFRAPPIREEILERQREANLERLREVGKNLEESKKIQN